MSFKAIFFSLLSVSHCFCPVFFFVLMSKSDDLTPDFFSSSSAKFGESFVLSKVLVQKSLSYFHFL